MKLAVPMVCALLLGASSTLYAQAPEGGKGGERREKMKAAHSQAQKACEGKSGPEHQECMVKQMCAQAKDAKACEERASKMKDAHRDAVKACEGKTGPEQRDCM